jgi:hypothetical protein
LPAGIVLIGALAASLVLAINAREYSHAANAALTLIAFCAMILSTLIEHR